MNLWIYMMIAGFLALIWAIVLPSKPNKTKQGTSLDDLEESLNSFTAGLEEDNRELTQNIQYLKREHELQKNELMMRIEYLEKRSLQIEDDTRRVARTVEDEMIYLARTGGKKNADGSISDAEQNVVVEEPKKLVERYPELFDLHQQGKSIEFIAKKIGMNKGEVILIIDLAKQGEEI